MESGTRLTLLLSLVLIVNAIGSTVALGIWLYRQEIANLIDLRQSLQTLVPRALALPLVGLLGGVVAGALIHWGEPSAKGSGIVQVQLAMRGLPLPMTWRVALVKLLASGVAIGSGFPVGPEGPSIQIGASVAGESSRRLGGKRHQRLALAIGSGAGLAAVFFAPLGGVAFILEEMLGRGSIRVNAIAVLATFIATAWTRLLSHPDGGPPLLRNLLPIIEDPSQSTQLRMVDLPILLLLGALAGLLAVPYQRLILGLRRRLVSWRWPAWRLLPLVGLLVGLAGTLLPISFDDPSKLAFDALEGLTSPGQALQVLVVQGAGMALAVAADAPGGMLAPALVVGASLASLVQTVLQAVGHEAPPSLLFAGAAAMLAAINRLPLTAILLSFELSKNYDLLLPIGFCALTAIAVADQLAPSSLGEAMLEEALNPPTHPPS